SVTGEGVSIYDGRDVQEVLTSETNWDYVDDGVVILAETVTVKGFVTSDVEQKLQEISKKLDEFRSNDYGIDFGSLTFSTKTVRTDNWNEEWRKYYKPIVLDRIAVVPDWIDFDDKSKQIIRLEPGMAFGTGEHASTRLCLSLLEKLDISHKKVIDVGTGSGILGIAAAKLGAKSVYMTDIDPVAVDVAKSNAVKNNVQDVCIIECADLSDRIECDILIGNLTADILLRLLSSFEGKVQKNTDLILSGIIAERLDEVLSAYQKAGFALQEVLAEDDWRAVRLKA
ncbi:MAG: 50S ribosomal protein L11 methyltransferase, partial [Clostridia bacterium]|nr:50S ribosomal protein L11 methyltransferase [Clostridia bacterium]